MRSPLWAGLILIALGAVALLTVMPSARAAPVRSTVAATVAAGSVLLPRQARLSFSGTGAVREVLVRPGQRVAEGLVLARLQGHDELEAILALAEATSESRLIDAQSGVRNAQIDADNARRTLAATRDSETVARTLRDQQERVNVAQKRYDDAFLGHRDGSLSDEFLSARRNDLLLAQERLDASQQNAATALATAENNLAKTEDALRRAREQQERFLTLGDTELSRARDNVRNSVLIAPFSAIVEEVGVVPGESVRSGVTAVTLVDTATMQVIAQVDETDIVNVVPGQQVKITIAALANADVTGVVAHIGVIGKTQAGAVMFPVTISLPSGVQGARSGMSALVELGTS